MRAKRFMNKQKQNPCLSVPPPRYCSRQEQRNSSGPKTKENISGMWLTLRIAPTAKPDGVWLGDVIDGSSCSLQPTPKQRHKCFRSRPIFCMRIDTSAWNDHEDRKVCYDLRHMLDPQEKTVLDENIDCVLSARTLSLYCPIVLLSIERIQWWAEWLKHQWA